MSKFASLVNPLASPTTFVFRTLMQAGDSKLQAGSRSRTFSQFSSAHNLSESCFTTRSPTLTAYQNDRLQSLWYSISQTLDSNLPNHFHMFNTYSQLTILNCKCDHVIEVIAVPCFISNDVPASKIQVNEVFNACWPAHISPTKTPTRFNQVWFGSSFKET